MGLVPRCHTRMVFGHRGGGHGCHLAPALLFVPPPASLKASAPEAAHLQHLRQPDGPQPQCQPLQSSQSVKGMNQRVVTLAQHISVINLVFSFPWGARGGGKGHIQSRCEIYLVGRAGSDARDLSTAGLGLERAGCIGHGHPTSLHHK